MFLFEYFRQCATLACRVQYLIDSESQTVSRSIVLQEYEDHGLFLSKVYFLGSDTEVQLRRSLHISNTLIAQADSSAVILLPRLSTTPADISNSVAVEEREASTPGAGEGAGTRQPAENGAREGGSSTGRYALNGVWKEEGGAGSSGLERGRCAAVIEGQRPRRIASDDKGGPRVAWAAKTGLGRDVTLVLDDPPISLGPGVAHMLPPWLPGVLGKYIRETVGLTVLNMDVIRPRAQARGEPERYCVVDINYFPGMTKIPNFETRFVAFLAAMVGKEPSRR
jgi:hypothetical protein